jgi:hypothetical protein
VTQAPPGASTKEVLRRERTVSQQTKIIELAHVNVGILRWVGVVVRPSRSALCATAVRFSSKGVAVVFVLFSTFETCVLTSCSSVHRQDVPHTHLVSLLPTVPTPERFRPESLESSAHLVAAALLRSWS